MPDITILTTTIRLLTFSGTSNILLYVLMSFYAAVGVAQCFMPSLHQQPDLVNLPVIRVVGVLPAHIVSSQRQGCELVGETIPLQFSGMENVKIRDRCGAMAYQIPQGSLLIYAPAKGLNGQEVTSISTTGIAPAILRNFNTAVPGYMSKGNTV